MVERELLLEALRVIEMMFGVIRVMNRFLVTNLRGHWSVEWGAYTNLYQAAAFRADALARDVAEHYGASIDD